MRYILWTLLILALPVAAQWWHFGAVSPDAAATAPSIARDMIAAHNAVRAQVGTAPLIWSDQLASVAQKWADHLVTGGNLAHSGNPKYGENLYEITGATATPADVVNAWAGESKNYDYGSNSCRSVCGHYTQVVWSDTKSVGCAAAGNSARQVWVCEYDPPGNYVGRKPY